MSVINMLGYIFRYNKFNLYHIMKNYIYGLGIIITLFVTSCDFYESEVPITNSKKSIIDTNAIGNWGYFEGDTLKFGIRIDALNNNQYILNCIDIGSLEDIGMYDNFIAHSSSIENHKYINIKNLKREENKYLIFKYELKGDSLITYTISDLTFEQQFDSSKKFEKYIKNNIEYFDSLFKPIHRLIRFEPGYK